MKKTPGKFAVQFVTDIPGGLDFNVTTANSLDDAFGIARDVIATHPDFKWDGVIVWKDMTADDIRLANEQMEKDNG